MPSSLVDLVNEHRGRFPRLLGLRFTRVEPDLVEAVLPVRPELHQPYGIVHGGVYASAMETLCSTGAALRVLGEGRSAVGLENHTSFVRAVRSGTLSLRAWPEHPGRRTQLWAGEVRDEEGRLVAVSRVRVLVLEEGAEVAGRAVALEDDPRGEGEPGA